MLRFRNPSSSIDTMLASFETLYVALKDKVYFNNDDIAQVLAKSNLMASSGFTGDVALSLGANTDKSRDKTYNNAKMFAEIFRLLGLISIVNNVSSNYRFTYIGDHLVLPTANKKAIIEQCVLGVNNPNNIIDVSYSEEVRFFSCVLLAMEQLDGYISRDEMILGPMCVSDVNTLFFSNMIQHIREIRGDQIKIQKELEKLASSLQANKKDGMTVVSVQNCTRFPISVLKYCGWVESENKKINGKTFKFMSLTKRGKYIVNILKNLKDIRLKDYNQCSLQVRNALIRLGVYSMLARADFDISCLGFVSDDQELCKKILDNKDILFSPYQTLEYNEVNKALLLEDKLINDRKEECNFSEVVIKPITNIAKVEDVFIDQDISLKEHNIKTNDEYIEKVNKLYGEYNDIDKITQIIIHEHIKDKKTEFYPFIEKLYRIIGVDCHKSRDGVNGERWDAMIKDSNRSIPIEIKSPTEELHISVKAIRQALENKIILLSRETYKTKKDCSSFAVGYLPPNERAEVVSLIYDIKRTFGYSIAVFDLETLIKITANIIIFGKGINLEKLYHLEGLVNVKCFEN